MVRLLVVGELGVYGAGAKRGPTGNLPNAETNCRARAEQHLVTTATIGPKWHHILSKCNYFNFSNVICAAGLGFALPGVVSIRSPF